MSASLTVPPSMEGVWSRRGYVGLVSRVVICTRAHAMLQPCPYVRVNPAACGAVEEDIQGAHEVPGMMWAGFTTVKRSKL